MFETTLYAAFVCVCVILTRGLDLSCREKQFDKHFPDCISCSVSSPSGFVTPLEIRPYHAKALFHTLFRQ